MEKKSFEEEKDEIQYLVKKIKEQKKDQQELQYNLKKDLDNAVKTFETEKIRIKFLTKISKKAVKFPVILMVPKSTRMIGATALVTTATIKAMKNIVAPKEKMVKKEVLVTKTEERKTIIPKVKIVTKTILEVEDFENEIVDAMVNMEEITKNIDTGLTDITELQKDCAKKFLGQHGSKEYKDLTSHLDAIEIDLHKNKKDLEEMMDKQEKNLDKNAKQLKLTRK